MLQGTCKHLPYYKGGNVKCMENLLGCYGCKLEAKAEMIGIQKLEVTRTRKAQTFRKNESALKIGIKEFQ